VGGYAKMDFSLLAKAQRFIIFFFSQTDSLLLGEKDLLHLQVISGNHGQELTITT
jgi:hypothetical protein